MHKEIKIGFIINPIAGMGGRVGLKGTDDVVDKALALGAVPIAQKRACAMLGTFKQLQHQSPNEKPIIWLTCAGSMGADVLSECGFPRQQVIYSNNRITTRKDTVEATHLLVSHGADIVVFCGGDGTARDISSETKTSIPILGVPSGVKMYSGVFGSTAEQTAHILNRFLND